MKKIIVILIFLSFNYLHSQNNKITIEAIINAEKIDCEKDTISKVILLEMYYNDKYNVVKKFITKKCRNYYEFPKFVGKFKATIQMLNYEEKVILFDITKLDKDTIRLKNIYLELDKTIKLKEVTVNGVSKQKIRVEADKTTISINDNDMYSGGSTYEALTKIPSVLLDPNGNIILNGKRTTIWIDGQPSSLSGQDLINFLNNLPATVVEKAEIISNPGSAYDARSYGGIINIVTSNKTIKGLSGSINVNYEKNRYDKKGISTNLIGKIKDFNWQFSAGLNSNKGSEEKKIKSVFLDQNPSQILNQNYFTLKSNETAFIRTNFDYKFDEYETIGFKYNFNTIQNKPYTTGSIFSENLNSNILSTTLNNSTEKNTQNEFTSYYKQKMDDDGSLLTITGNLSLYNKDNFTRLQQNNNSSPVENFSIFNNNLSINNHYVKVDVFIPESFTAFDLYTGAKIAFSKVISEGLYNLNNVDSDIINNNTFNNEIIFNYNERNIAYYLEAKKKLNKFSFNTGLRIENFKIESNIGSSSSIYKREYTNLFPSASILYELNSAMDWSASYTRKIQQPGYSELDPNFNGYFDSFTTIQGNPNLQPNFYNNFETKLSILKYAFLGFNYSHSKSDNFLIIQNSGNLQTTQTYLTFNNVDNFNFNLAIPIPFAVFTKGMDFFKSKINIDKTNYLYMMFGYNNYRINNANEYVNSFNTLYYINLFSQINLPKEIKLNLNYSYTTKGSYQIYSIDKPIQRLDISLSKTFFNKALKVNINIKDIFNSYEINALSKSPNLDTNYYSKLDSQSFRIGIAYNFGKFFSALPKSEEEKTQSDKDRIDKKTEIGPKSNN